MPRGARRAALPVFLCAISLGVMILEITGRTDLGLAVKGALAPLAQAARSLDRGPPPSSTPHLLSDASSEAASLRHELGILKDQLHDFNAVSREPWSHFRPVSARVLFLSGWEEERRLAVIDRGRCHGLGPGMGVVKGRQAVGRILRVTDDHAVLRFLSDPGCKLPATLLPPGGDGVYEPEKFEGILEGRIAWGGEVQLRHIHTSVPVVPGDFVLTSGRSGHFPQGLTAGCVTGVGNPDYSQFHEIRLRPDLTYGNLRSVLVLVPVLDISSPKSLEAGR